MKIKLRYWVGLTLAVLFVIYCGLAYHYMWRPIFRYHPRYSAHACVNNLRQIDAAINQFALEHGKHTGDPVTFDDITPYIKLDRFGKVPSCPAGGIYTIDPIGTSPTCSLGTNLPARVRWGLFYWEYADHRLPD